MTRALWHASKWVLVPLVAFVVATYIGVIVL